MPSLPSPTSLSKKAELERFQDFQRSKVQQHQTHHLGTSVSFEESRNKPDPFFIQSIRDEAEELRQSLVKLSISITSPMHRKGRNTFSIRDWVLDILDFDDGKPAFVYRQNLQIRRRKSHPNDPSLSRPWTILLKAEGPLVDFEYYSIGECFYLGTPHFNNWAWHSRNTVKDLETVPKHRWDEAIW